MRLKEKCIKIIVIVIDIIYCLIFPYCIVGAMISPMVFDAPDSTESLSNWILFIATSSMPIVILASAITSLILLFKLESYKKAFMFSLLPIINLIAILFVFLTC